MLEVHHGRFFGGVFALAFCLAALAMPLLSITGLALYVLRRRSDAARRSAPPRPVHDLVAVRRRSAAAEPRP